jgi:release factor glutamine methyltransferase
MLSILDFQKKYHKKISHLDLDLLISAAIQRPREFVLAHPEYKIPKTRNSQLETFIKRRLKNEPLAYILGAKEFYGLEFKVNNNTLIPRPETELLVELASHNIKHGTWNNRKDKPTIVDIGTGSGNIIISLIKKLQNDGLPVTKYQFYAVDISQEALRIAKKNAKKHNVDKKIKFIHGNLLEPIIKKCRLSLLACRIIIVANLPYLSNKIYKSAPTDVKKYEPKSALYSSKHGLGHYEKLFKQINLLNKTCRVSRVSCLIEISPEQKKPIFNLTKKYFPTAKISFQKDLARKWRISSIRL